MIRSVVRRAEISTIGKPVPGWVSPPPPWAPAPARPARPPAGARRKVGNQVQADVSRDDDVEAIGHCRPPSRSYDRRSGSAQRREQPVDPCLGDLAVLFRRAGAAADAPGDDVVGVHHHFGIPPLEQFDLGPLVRTEGPWEIHHNDGLWSYVGVLPGPERRLHVPFEAELASKVLVGQRFRFCPCQGRGRPRLLLFGAVQESAVAFDGVAIGRQVVAYVPLEGNLRLVGPVSPGVCRSVTELRDQALQAILGVVLIEVAVVKSRGVCKSDSR